MKKMFLVAIIATVANISAMDHRGLHGGKPWAPVDYSYYNYADDFPGRPAHNGYNSYSYSQSSHEESKSTSYRAGCLLVESAPAVPSIVKDKNCNLVEYFNSLNEKDKDQIKIALQTAKIEIEKKREMNVHTTQLDINRTDTGWHVIDSEKEIAPEYRQQNPSLRIIIKDNKKSIIPGTTFVASGVLTYLLTKKQ